MGTFDPGRKYTKDEVAVLAPDLFRELHFDYMMQPGAWGTTPRLRSASTSLFEEGAADGGLLNAAAE